MLILNLIDGVIVRKPFLDNLSQILKILESTYFKCVGDNFVIDCHFNQVQGEVETEKAVISLTFSCFPKLLIFDPNFKNVLDRPYQMNCLDFIHFYHLN